MQSRHELLRSTFISIQEFLIYGSASNGLYMASIYNYWSSVEETCSVEWTLDIQMIYLIKLVVLL